MGYAESAARLQRCVTLGDLAGDEVGLGGLVADGDATVAHLQPESGARLELGLGLAPARPARIHRELRAGGQHHVGMTLPEGVLGHPRTCREIRRIGSDDRLEQLCRAFQQHPV